jgi:hypothetical protein
MRGSKKQKKEQQRELESLRLQSEAEKKAVADKQAKGPLTFRLEIPSLKK